jgi:hypothetical protein
MFTFDPDLGNGSSHPCRDFRKGPYRAVGPYSVQLSAALCRSLQRREHNYLIFLPLRPRCMIGDLGVISDGG